MSGKLFRKKLFLIGLLILVPFQVPFVFAGNPVSLLAPADSVLDPGSVETPWGGCGPTDSNCYILPTFQNNPVQPVEITNTEALPPPGGNASVSASVISSTNDSSLISALRNLFAVGLPSDLMSKLRGPKGADGRNGSNGQDFDSSSFVSRIHFDNQVDRTFDSLENSVEDITSSIEKAVATNLLTVNGRGTFTGVPTLAHVFTAWPAGVSSVSDSTVYINPASAAADTNLIGAAVNGTVKFLVDAEGDIYANNLILSGSTTTGATTVAGSLTVQDNTTLGDAGTDTVTVTPLTASRLVFTDASKILTSTGNSSAVSSSVSDETGSGALVFATSPALVTPNLGTPSALILTNATGLPASSVLAGTFGTGAYTMDTSLTTPTLYGSSAINGDITIEGTSSATKTTSYVILQPTSGNVGVGTATPGAKLEVVSGNVLISNNQSYQVKDTGGTGRNAIKLDSSVEWYLGDSGVNSGFHFVNQLGGEPLTIHSEGRIGFGITSPTAVLHLKAGTATASTAPLKFTSGALLTTAEAGAVEFLTDAYYGTITTGGARKTFAFLESPSFTTPSLGAATYTTLSGGNITDSGLTATRVTFAGTGGLLSDDADLTFATDTLSATKLLSSTSVSTPSLISTGAITMTPGAGTNLNVSLSTTGDFAVNTNQLYVDTSNGNVGIGTTGPVTKLDVVGNVAVGGGQAAFWTPDANSRNLIISGSGANPNYGILGLMNNVAESSGANMGGVLWGQLTNGKSGTNPSLKALIDARTSGSGGTVGGFGGYLAFYTKPDNGVNDIATYERMRIDMSGNVGIGQTVPTSKLDITTAGLGVTQTTSSGLALVNTTAAAVGAQQISPALRWSGFGWKTDAVAASQAVDFRSFVVPVQGAVNPTGYLSFGSSVNGGAYSDGQMVITTAGNVGIGTTSPIGKMQIVAPSGWLYVTNATGDTPGVAIGANASAGIISSNTGVPLTFAINSSEKMRIDTAGNVGIGTTSPASHLQIGGNLSASAWTTTGIAFDSAAATYTDTSTAAAGTVAVRTANSFGAPTFASTNAITVTDAFSLYVPKPIAGTNTTITRANSAYFEGNVGIGTTTPLSKLQINGAVSIGTAQPSLFDSSAYDLLIGSGGTYAGATIYTSNTGQGSILFADGTTGSEAYRGRIIYSHSNDALTLSTAGTANNFTMDSNGRFGVDTSTMDAKLTVQASSAADSDKDALRLTGGDNSTGSSGMNQILLSYDDSSSWTHAIKTRHNSGATTGNAIDFYTWDYSTDASTVVGTKHGMTITNGNVGIGTTAPNTLLEIVKSDRPELRIRSSSTGSTNNPSISLYSDYTGVGERNWGIRTSTTTLGDLNILQSNTLGGDPFAGTSRLYIKNDGNVGIGTTSPTAVLHLKAGTATANTAPLKFTSGSLLTTAEAGAVEFLTDAYYGTITTGAARKTFAFLESPSFTTPTLGVAIGTSLALGGATIGTNALAITGTVSAAGIIESTSGGFKFPDGTTQTTASTAFDPTTMVELMEEFVGGDLTNGNVGDYGWQITGTGSVNYPTVSNSNNIGSIEIRSGTTGNGGETMYLGGPNGQWTLFGNQPNYTIRISAANAQAANANAFFSLGFFTTGNGNPTNNPANGVYFRASGTGNWYAVTRASDVETATDTGVAQSTSYKVFKLVMNSAGTSVGFYIDGVLKATHTTNIPASALPVGSIQVSTFSGTNYTLNVEYYYLKITGLSRADLAENYPVEDSSIEAGDLVRVKKDQASSSEKYVVEKTLKAYDPQIIGTVSTEPAMVFGEKGNDNLRPVALVGRVPVKVSTTNGAISAGDYLASSDIPGVAMKSTKPGTIIGTALEAYSAENPEEIGKIMVFVNPHFALGTADENPAITLGDRLNAFFNEVITKVENGVAYMKALVVDTFTVGSPTKPTGITVYDKKGQAGCLEVEDVNTNAVSIRPGACGAEENLPDSSGDSGDSGEEITETPTDTSATETATDTTTGETITETTTEETTAETPSETTIETGSVEESSAETPIVEESAPEPAPAEEPVLEPAPEVTPVPEI